MIKDFFAGAACVFSGIKAFYSDRKAWRYAIIPLGVMTVVYGLLIWAIHYAVAAATATLNGWAEQWPVWISWIAAVAGVIFVLFGAIVGLFLLSMTVSTFYEIIGGIFFDPLVEYYEKRKFGKSPVRMTIGQQIIFRLQTVVFGITTFVLFAVVWLAGSFIPVAGQIALILTGGFITAVAYMVCSACNDGVMVGDLVRRSAGNKAAVAGFGVAAYLMLTIPFAALFFVPGIVIGGAELYNDFLGVALPEKRNSR